MQRSVLLSLELVYRGAAVVFFWYRIFLLNQTMNFSACVCIVWGMKAQVSLFILHFAILGMQQPLVVMVEVVINENWAALSHKQTKY